MDALKLIANPPKTLGSLYVLHGDEDFLKRHALHALLRSANVSDDSPDYTTHPGDKANYAEVFSELETFPFFDAKRIVVVENAEPFVTKNRARLEKAIGKLPDAGMLVLVVKSWPANTKLYRMVGAESAIGCKTPPSQQLAGWVTQWAKSRYGKQINRSAASMLVEVAGVEMGVLDQELQKLANYVGKKPQIDETDVDRLVGNSRGMNVWKIFDALANGQAKEALRILAGLFDEGEEPIRLLGAFSMQLRRLAQAARLAKQGRSMRDAMQQAGLPPFATRTAEQQLRRLGRERSDQLYDWLLEIDLGLKGGSELPPRTLFERLLLRLAATPKTNLCTKTTN